MTDPTLPVSDEQLVAIVDARLAALRAECLTMMDRITALAIKQARLGHHPNHAAYVAGGMLLDKKFDPGHIFALFGFHALDWREALARLAAGGPTETSLLAHLRLACEIDPMLEVAGEALVSELGLLKYRGAIDFWFQRPKLGLGQAAKAFGIEPAHADGHRGLYALALPVLRRGFEKVSSGMADQRFGALLLPLISEGGERLAEIGADAFHADAEARYCEDCRRFEEHQRDDPNRRWRWKPPLARQGHLAITTARAKDVVPPEARTRGHAANWLDDHDANIRFTREG